VSAQPQATASLSVPEIEPDADVLSAALAYAKAGWYVGPCARGTKHPGSVLGSRWQDRTSQDPKVIVNWFAGTDHGLFLHAGRSGAVILDVDRPELIPDDWRELLAGAPFQRTRESDIARGHYVFAMPAGRAIGNPDIPGGAGEVRGANGVIIVAPSAHEKADQGGLYRWARTGAVTVLPNLIAAALPRQGGPSGDAASDATLARFLTEYTGSTAPELLRAPLARFAEKASVGSRHSAAVEAAAWIAREAAVGLYPARQGFGELSRAFAATFTTEERGRGRGGPGELTGVIAWAVGQLSAASVTEQSERAGKLTDTTAFTSWADGIDLASSVAVQGAGGGDVSDPFEDAVAKRVLQLRVDEEARRRIRADERPEMPDALSLTNLLALELPEQKWVIGDLLHAEGLSLLFAPQKAGKSTLIGNLVRSLADGSRFLGMFEVPTPVNVGVIDTESGDRRLQEWMRDQGILKSESVRMFSLRGKEGSLDPRDQQARAWWIAALQGLDVVVLDVSGPVLAATGLDENDNTDVATFWVGLRSLLAEAGVTSGLVVHHTGHNESRAIGASAWLRYPDSIWRIEREDEDPTSPRYFSAYGRDVDVWQGALDYDQANRHLTYRPEGKAKAKVTREALWLAEFVRNNPGLGRNELARSTGKSSKSIDAATRAALSSGLIRQEDGPNRTKLNYPPLIDITTPGGSGGSCGSG
jgi:hypothetical protein